MTDQPVRNATAALFRRYLAILEAAEDCLPAPDPRAVISNLRWMCRTALENIGSDPIDKLSRWLGFVQGTLVMHGLAAVDAEREFSRPLFHAAYRAADRPVPPTRATAARCDSDGAIPDNTRPDATVNETDTLRAAIVGLNAMIEALNDNPAGADHASFFPNVSFSRGRQATVQVTVKADRVIGPSGDPSLSAPAWPDQATLLGILTVVNAVNKALDAWFDARRGTPDANGLQIGTNGDGLIFATISRVELEI